MKTPAEQDSVKWIKSLVDREGFGPRMRTWLLNRWERHRLCAGLTEANKAIRQEIPLMAAVIAQYPALIDALIFDAAARERWAKGAADEVLCLLSSVECDSYLASLKAGYRMAAQVCADRRIEPFDLPKKPKQRDYEKAVLRMACEDWWHRTINKEAKRAAEHLEIAKGNVNRNTPYCSDNCVKQHQRTQKRQRSWMEEMAVASDFGDVLKLSEVVDSSMANPELRRVELLVRTAGLEKQATEEGRIGYFLTFTAPSRFHKASKKWNGCSPVAAHNWILDVWKRIRAKLNREQIDYYGLRVVEPHQDGTAHWHAVVFLNPDQVAEFKRICRRWCLQDEGKEKGAWRHRFHAKYIDPEKGSAVGYVIKYLSKNLNGAHMADELSEETPCAHNSKPEEADLNVPETIDRVVAWARRFGIRQFQFFGTGSVTLWRECRRTHKQTGPFPETFEEARAAAVANKWDAFCEVARSLQLEYEIEKEAGRYSDDTRRVIGVRAGDQVIHTRPKKWALVRPAKRDELIQSARGAPWSPTNNCTPCRKGDALDRHLALLGVGPEARSILERGGFVTSRLGDRYFALRGGQLREYH
ncbi:replication endonuclease [Ferrimonas balearica]|uniref:replication endonuclease n=1 Tax=Ferrimonas balearica TaxID=44012 RepID=UPI001C9978EC|nr:replication endonuclease [Ferrimonas balearica]MBY5920407.1 replication endonuclease [Ferrimonas balearica]MBY5996908.1 replication endonuclease [Ferrimonas balearica]